MRKRRELFLDFTSLLDVIMIILFVVIGNVSQTSAKVKEEAEQTEKQLEEAQLQVEQLTEEVQLYQNREQSEELYLTEVVIINVSNTGKTNHILTLSEENWNTNEKILLKNDNFDNIKARINDYLYNVVRKTENQPVYIVFTVSADRIYGDEYDTISQCLKNFQSNHKNVFYKEIMG